MTKAHVKIRNCLLQKHVTTSISSKLGAKTSLSGSSLFKTTSKVPLYLSTYCGFLIDKEDLLSIIIASHDECLIDQLYKARLTEISVIRLIGHMVYGYMTVPQTTL